MRVGLYRDLALGVDPDGAEAWGEQCLLAEGISAGAPPDALGLKGQSWGLPPFNPHALRDAAYRPFIECLRANMRHAGALRIDHIMGLTRLFWIPRGSTPSEGGYVRYPLDDLLAILSLESERAHCTIIGEDLGTVPKGLRERLAASRVLSTRVLYFERNGAFRPAQSYPALAHVGVGTHDLPTFPGYWHGRDIATRSALHLLPHADSEAELQQDRAGARQALIAMLREAGLLATSRGDMIPLNELVDAVYRFLATSPARLLMVQPEDLMGVEEQSNLPGTVAEHPNWQRKLPLAWERFVASPRFQHFAELMNKLRPRRLGS
jgi:4-alpha-glucanotransferase